MGTAHEEPLCFGDPMNLRLAEETPNKVLLPAGLKQCHPQASLPFDTSQKMTGWGR